MHLHSAAFMKDLCLLIALVTETCSVQVGYEELNLPEGCEEGRSGGSFLHTLTTGE